MKQLKRLTLSGLAKESIMLSRQEQMELYAGSGIDGLCYFEALEIMSSTFGCNYSENYYINDYAATHGGYSSIFVTDASGNFTSELKGVTASDALSYLSTQFHGSTVGVSDYISALNDGKQIITDISTGPGVSHAVVITGYDSTLQVYTYQDANGQLQAVTANQFGTSFSMAVDNAYAH